jgi:hypothetical protein
MPLSPSKARRVLKHTRIITVEAFARDDGLWDLDAHITDIKTRDGILRSGLRAAGEPWHDLWLRISIDEQMQIVDVEAVSDRVPYPGFCEAIGPDYRKLIGLSLRQGFRQQLLQRMKGIAGCTHLTELAQVLPTAAMQAFAGEVNKLQEGDELDAHRPFQLDRCHALRIDGAAVAQFYPRWARKAQTES